MQTKANIILTKDNGDCISGNELLTNHTEKDTKNILAKFRRMKIIKFEFHKTDASHTPQLLQILSAFAHRSHCKSFNFNDCSLSEEVINLLAKAATDGGSLQEVLFDNDGDASHLAINIARSLHPSVTKRCINIDLNNITISTKTEKTRYRQGKYIYTIILPRL